MDPDDMARDDFSVDMIALPGYYRILEGEHANRVVIHSIVGNKIDAG